MSDMFRGSIYDHPIAPAAPRNARVAAFRERIEP